MIRTETSTEPNEPSSLQEAPEGLARLPATSAPSPLAVARPSTTGAAHQLQVLANRAVAESAYRIRRLGITGIAGLALLIVAIVLFLGSNLQQSSTVANLNAQLGALSSVVNTPMRAQVAPVSLGSLPRRSDMAGVVDKVIEQASAAGIELPRGQYEYLPARDGMAAHYRMNFPVHASYPALRDFMNRTLTALPAVAVEGLRVERKSVGDNTVDADLTLSAYLRGDE